MRLALIATLFVVGCADDDHASNRLAPDDPDPGWAGTSCPDGATLLGAAPPAGFEAWCERDLGHGLVREGPYAKWWQSGAKLTDGAFAADRRDGVWRTFHEHGALASSGRWTAGVPDGEHWRWRPDRTVIERTTFAAGLREGPFTRWWADGVAALDGSYRADREHGLWVARWEDGTLREEVTWRDGLREGPYTAYAWGGVLETEGAYEAGAASGTWRSYWPDGTTRAEGEMVAGMREGLWRTFDAAGRKDGEGPYHLGLQHGPFTFWYHADGGASAALTAHASGGEVIGALPPRFVPYRADGLMVSGNFEGAWIGTSLEGAHELWRLTYVSGRQQGRYTVFYPDGELYLEGGYADGRPHGPFKSYHPDGQVAETLEFFAGARDGEHHAYRPDGSEQLVGAWSADERTGTWKRLWPDGTPHIQAEYLRDRMNGAYTAWHDNHQKAAEGRFANGSPQGEFGFWDRDGRAIEGDPRTLEEPLRL